MKQIEFFDREKEMEEIKNILDTEPTMITFIYGPINSGKTELINYLSRGLSNEYVGFYVNLRGRFLSSYKDFVRALFKIEKEKKDYKEILKAISTASLKTLKFAGIPITEDVLDLFFKDKTYEDVFEFLEEYFDKVSENRIPVLVLDELQKIGEVKVDGMLIYELFNFFVRLTKERHLVHVFAVSSDSSFIERVYSEAMLQGRCEYLLVDDFDYARTMAFLDKYNFSEEEKEITWNYCGGKPVYLIGLIKARDRVKKAKEYFKIRMGQIEELIYSLKAFGDEVKIKEKLYKIKFEEVVKILSEFKDKESIPYRYITPEIYYLVKNNVFFVNPIEKRIKNQSRLDLLAIREILKSIE
ncbi:MAG: ATP-binding protein [Methanosarcinales archaeon]